MAALRAAQHGLQQQGYEQAEHEGDAPQSLGDLRHRAADRHQHAGQAAQQQVGHQVDAEYRRQHQRQRIDGFAARGLTQSDRPPVAGREQAGLGTPGADLLGVELEVAAPHAEIDQPQAAEARHQEADGAEDQPQAGGVVKPQRLPAQPDRECLPRTQDVAERDQEPVAREQRRQHRQDDEQEGQAQTEQALQGELRDDHRGGTEDASRLAPRRTRTQRDGDEGEVEQVEDEILQAVAANAKERRNPVVERQQQQTRDDRVGDEKGLEESDPGPQQRGDGQCRRDDPEVDEQRPREIHDRARRSGRAGGCWIATAAGSLPAPEGGQLASRLVRRREVAERA